MTRRTASKRLKKNTRNKFSSQSTAPKSPFIEHLYELRKRLFYVAVSVLVFGVAAYGVQQHIVNALLKPAKHQQFIYTTPGGGIDFLFRLCLYVGIACSIPVIVFQMLKYLEPLIKKDAVRFIGWGSFASSMLAIAGMVFGYFVGLPAALHFLLHQFSNHQIQALLSIQSYMSFVMIYLLGSALLFQMPLILLLINRIKPLKPGKLLKYERWVIAAAVILGGILNPTPNIVDQAMLAGPMILTYQVGILLIWFVNRGKQRPKKVTTLLERDAAMREERLERFQTAAQQAQAVAVHRRPQAVRPAVVAQTAVAPVPLAQPTARRHVLNARPPARRRYINDFQRRSYFAPGQQAQPE